MTYALVDIRGPEHDLHSGGFGGGIDNPLNVMAHIITKLKDENGRILIPGFYDTVRPLTDQERTRLNEFPIDEAHWLASTGAPQTWGEADYSLAERIGARPTLDINGIVGGYTGPGAKTIIPAHVHAKISMRLVPDQNEDDIYDLFVKYVQDITPPTVSVSIEKVHGARASMIDISGPAMQAATNAYAHIFGNKPVFKRNGGSIPVVGDFQRYLGLQTVMMGFGLPDDRLHSPNERFYLPNYYQGIQTVIRFLSEYAQLHQA